VGRGTHFWHHFYPELQKRFPENLSKVSVTEFYNACNRVAPSFIRTEADELTYHFHVLIRYELEKALLDGTLEVKDLPAAWNAAYTKYLGITPPDDKQGVLQDVHWSHGMFGYFPTYTLGSFYAVQFFEQARIDIPDLDLQIADGRFGALLQWLRAHIHAFGRMYSSEELCTRVTGRGLDPNVFLAYANRKFGAIYPGA
jgi:carboxypeptidase Taq